GMALAAAAEYGAGPGRLREESQGLSRPCLAEFAVAIDELHERQFRFAFHQPPKAGIAGPRGGEFAVHVQFDDIDALGARPGDRTVARSGIDIDQPCGAAGGSKATLEALAFVATDRNDAVLAFRFGGHR